jgi:hypothetical protein
MKATPATAETSWSGSAAPAAAPTATLAPWMSAAARTTPAITGPAGYRVANASTRSWLLSPNSAMKIAPNATPTAARKSTGRSYRAR